MTEPGTGPAASVPSGTGGGAPHAVPVPDPRLPFIAEHYRETFSHQREYIQKRDRLFVYALLAAVAVAFRASAADNSERVLTVVVEKVLGPGVQVDASFLGIMVWFVFFALVARYFQATLNVERQYDYISRVEQEITDRYGSDLFAREGKQYLRDYPRFGAWMHAIYSWVFPVAVILLTGWNAIVDCGRRGWTFGSVLVFLIAAITIATVGVYLYSTKFQDGAPWKKKKAEASAKTASKAPLATAAARQLEKPKETKPANAEGARGPTKEAERGHEGGPAPRQSEPERPEQARSEPARSEALQNE